MVKRWVGLAALSLAVIAALGVTYAMKARSGKPSLSDGNPGPPPAERPPRPKSRRPDGTPWESSPLGTNLMGPSFWDTNLAFVDLMRASGDWGSDPGDQALDLDPTSWPRRLADGQSGRLGVLLAHGASHAPIGQYTVLYEGRGRLRNLGNGRFDPSGSRPGRETFYVQEANEGGVLLDLMESDPTNPVRQVRVLLPGGACESDASRDCQSDADCGGEDACRLFAENYQRQIFNPIFLRRIRGYSVLRFMDWMGTNGSQQRRWSDRPTQESRSWQSESGKAGVPVEVLVELANRTGAHPWFTIPHAVDDDYVRRFAAIVAERLDPRLRAWVEYSNEVWNPAFDQHDYAKEQAAALGLSSDSYVATARFYSQRAVEIFRIFADEMGGTDRLVRVLGTQSVNTWWSRHVVSWQDAWREADALAVAPYFGFSVGQPDEAEAFEALWPDQIIDKIAAESLPESFEQMRAQREVALDFGLRLVAYEGGQHMVATWPARGRPKINALFDAIQRHPRMKELYIAYLKGWKEHGGEVMVHFSDCASFGNHGRWGSLEYLDQPRSEAPKYDGIQTFLEKTPIWW